MFLDKERSVLGMGAALTFHDFLFLEVSLSSTSDLPTKRKATRQQKAKGERWFLFYLLFYFSNLFFSNVVSFILGRVYFGCNKNRRAFSSSKSQSNTITKKSPLFLRQPISRSPFWGLLFSSSHATLMRRVGRDTRKRF